MNIRLLSLLILPLLVAVAAVTLSASETSAQPPMTRQLFAILRGSEEVPGPGDPDGIGAAHVVLNAAADQVCVTIGVANIQAATLAHIHVGARGAAGPPVVDLSGLIIPGTAVVQGCVADTMGMIDDIAANPAGFYVNVHNAQFPGGAVRGQLR